MAGDDDGSLRVASKTLKWRLELVVATKTETIPQTEDRFQDTSVIETFQIYVRQLADESKQEAQPEITKFVRWVGGERPVSSLTASEVGDFSDSIASKTSSASAAERASHVKQYLSFLKKKKYIDVNLSQHLRLRRARSSTGTRRSFNTDGRVVRLTRSGHNQLKKELRDLQKERIKLAAEIQLAAADKDVRENAPLEAARESQGMVSSRILEIEAILKASVVIGDDAPDRVTVRIGSKIRLTDVGSGRTVRYQLVDPSEANPLSGKISTASPVGAAILGRNRGEKITVNTPRGEQVYLIKSTS